VKAAVPHTTETLQLDIVSKVLYQAVLVRSKNKKQSLLKEYSLLGTFFNEMTNSLRKHQCLAVEKRASTSLNVKPVNFELKSIY
jgi:hypothetical protein